MRKFGLVAILIACVLCLMVDETDALLSHYQGKIEIIVVDSPNREYCLAEEDFPWKDCCWKNEDELFRACKEWFGGWPWPWSLNSTLDENQYSCR